MITGQSSSPAASMTNFECPYCHTCGLVRTERIFHGRKALTSYYCGACTRLWEVGDDETPDCSSSEPLPRRRQTEQT